MLLTSSQVAILLTTATVLICTSALFISGCLIQQRTLRDLRTAIKPVVVNRPKPRAWDTQQQQRRKATTIRLEDGSRVQINADVEVDVVEVRPTIADAVEDEIKGEWDGVQEGGETLSRAERRRRIKAEIQRLSHVDRPVGYQRRIW